MPGPISLSRNLPCALVAALCVSVLLLSACEQGEVSRTESEGGPDAGSAAALAEPKPLEIPDIEEVPEEVHENPLAEVDEAELRAAFVDDGLQVRLPITKKGDGALKGEIQLKLLDASAADLRELGSKQVKFTQDEDDTVHEVLLDEIASSWLRRQTGTLVIDWQVQTDDDEQALLGKRSLFAALGPLEVQLRGPSELTEGEGSPLRVTVVHRTSRKAIEGAEVVATYVPSGEDSELELFVGETDKFGELFDQVLLPPGTASGTLKVDISDEQEGQVWTTNAITVLTTAQHMHLSADKTIYKPGQDIKLRALALDGLDREPVAGQEAVFEAVDGKGLKVFKAYAKTDEYGVASASVPTDVRVNEGVWTFLATVGNSTQSLQIPVRRYVLPKMEVDVVPEAAFSLAGETLRGKVQARYVFGEPVQEAQVTLTMTAAGVGGTQLQGVTDEDGSYEFEWPVPEGLMQDVPLSLAATLVDPAGQQATASASVMLSTQAVKVELFPEHQPVTIGLSNRIMVLVSDPLGRPLVADVNLSGLEEEVITLKSNATGIASYEYVPQGIVNLHAEAVDGAGRTGAERLIIGSADEPPLLIQAADPLYGLGDEVRLLLRAPEAVDRVYVDLFRGVAGVGSATVQMKDGAGELRVDVSDAMAGMISAEAYTEPETVDAEPVMAFARFFVDSPKRLRINIAPNQDTFSPGEEATLGIEVTDAEGNPQVASVGLNVVNEASFTLGGEPTGSLDRSFALDTALLSTGVNILGQDSVDLMNQEPSEERDLLARSFFARLSNSAAVQAVPRFDYDSYASDMPYVQQAVASKVSLDANSLVNVLRVAFNGTEFEDSQWFDTVETMAKRLRDPFGQAYVVDVDRSTQVLTMTSWGPDEQEGTDDDASGVAGLFVPSPPVSTQPTTGSGVGAGTNAVAQGDIAFAPEPAQDALIAADGQMAMNGGVAQDPRSAAQPPGVAVRKDFRENVYSNPTLITDENGRAEVSFPLADSISTWRASADGSTTQGHLGSGRAAFRTFQSFFVDFELPTDLTQGDTLILPAVVYNYLSEEITVEVGLASADWLEIDAAETQQITLGPSEVRSVKFPVTVLEAGEQELLLTGSAGDITDALRRVVRVTPDGEPQDQTASGTLQDVVSHTLDVPEDAIEGGTSMLLTITPGFEADAAKGVESLLKEPNGCFEQTTSSAWPNTLVAKLLDDTGELTGDKRTETLDLITRGYQRLLTFESPTGGYNWWGNSEPGNRILSAIMLWHLKDMESLIETDPAVRDRTLQWLIAQQNADGSWDSGDALHAGDEVLGTSQARTTAFITWALAHTGWADEAVSRAADWLRANQVSEEDLYAMALVANALEFAAPGDGATTDVLNLLNDLHEETDQAQVVWHSASPSWTGSVGDMVTVELTGLVTYGLLHNGGYAASTAGAVSYLVASKDSVGTWYNTQATMNALRALSASARSGGDAEGTLSVWVNGEQAEDIAIDPAQSDVFKTIDLSAYAVTGENTIDLSFDGDGEVNYQITRRSYHAGAPEQEGPLSLSVEYDRQETQLGEPINVTAIASNNDEAGSRDQVIVQVGTAPGFAPNQDELQQLVTSGLVSRFEVRATDVTFYLMDLAAGERRALSFGLTPGLVMEGLTQSSKVYAYYQPTIQQTLEPMLLSVIE